MHTLLVQLQQRVFEVLHVHIAPRQLPPSRGPLHIPQRLLCNHIYMYIHQYFDACQVRLQDSTIAFQLQLSAPDSAAPPAQPFTSTSVHFRFSYFRI